MMEHNTKQYLLSRKTAATGKEDRCRYLLISVITRKAVEAGARDYL